MYKTFIDKTPPVEELIRAIREDDMSLVKQYLECNDLNTFINSKSKFARGTPLHAAARHNRVDMARLLLEKGAELNELSLGDQFSGGVTPLYTACLYNSLGVVQLFIEKKADIDKTGTHAWTPLYVATCSQQAGAYVDPEVSKEIVLLLCQNGADNSKSCKTGRLSIESLFGSNHGTPSVTTEGVKAQQNSPVNTPSP